MNTVLPEKFEEKLAFNEERKDWLCEKASLSGWANEGRKAGKQKEGISSPVREEGRRRGWKTTDISGWRGEGVSRRKKPGVAIEGRLRKGTSHKWLAEKHDQAGVGMHMVG